MQAALKYLQSVVKDTSSEMLLKQQEMWQKFSDEKKLMLTLEQIDTGMKLLEGNIRSRHPEWNNEEVQMEMLGMIYMNCYSDEEFEQIKQSVKEYNQQFYKPNNSER